MNFDPVLAHTLDCYREAKSLVGEAIALLLAANTDEAEPIVDILREQHKAIQGMER